MSAGRLLATAVHERVGADARGLSPGPGGYAADAQAIRGALPLAEVEAFPQGVLVRIPSRRPVRAFETELDPLGADAIVALADVLNELPEREARFVLHMDPLPEGALARSQMERLLRLRAEGWIALLGQLGVDPARIRIDVRGGRDPIASNATPLGREHNRRVEIIVH